MVSKRRRHRSTGRLVECSRAAFFAVAWGAATQSAVHRSCWSANFHAHVQDPHHLYGRISEAGGAKFWFHGLRNCFITVAERELMLPPSLTKRLVNHARPNDVTEGYAADWTVAQLREPAQKIADRIEVLMRGPEAPKSAPVGDGPQLNVFGANR